MEVQDNACKYGVWFTEPKVVHKMCFQQGVWAIYQDFCQDNPLIWTVHPGTSGCLNHDELGDRVFGVVSLGRDENSGAIISTLGRRLFFNNHKLKHGIQLDFLYSPAQVDVLTWGPPSTSYSLQQVKNDGQNVLQQCLLKGKQSFFAYYRIQLDKSKNASFYLTKDTCSQRVPNTPGVTTSRDQILPSEIDFNIFPTTADDDLDSITCEKFANVDTHFVRDQDEELNEISKDTPLDSEKLLSKESERIIEKRVDDETQRITFRLLNHHFHNEWFEESIHFKQWEFLSVVKQIFLKVCPAGMVPQFYIKQIYLLFHTLLQESFQHFPESINKDIETRKRILNALQVCLGNATRFQFKDGASCTQDAPLLKKEFENGTKVHLLIDMPSFIKIDPVNYDLLMESIWKLMNFAHYYCADHFQEFASDHSLLEGHWYSLFSPLVIRRWKYPGRAYRVMRQIFASINLERSVKNLDFCVSAARLHSSYQGWLKRPLSHWDKVKKFDKGAKLIWNKQAHCLDDFMYPAYKMGFPIEKCGIRLPKLPKREMDNPGYY